MFEIPDMTTEGTDRSNRLPSQSHIQNLITSFTEKGVLRTAPENRMLLGMGEEDFQRYFQGEQISSWQWRTKRKPNSSTGEFQKFTRTNEHAKMIILAGQHRKLALVAYIAKAGKGEEESFWVANVYNMDTLPKSTYAT